METIGDQVSMEMMQLQCGLDFLGCFFGPRFCPHHKNKCACTLGDYCSGAQLRRRPRAAAGQRRWAGSSPRRGCRLLPRLILPSCPRSYVMLLRQARHR
jgi:hypothetical protein